MTRLFQSVSAFTTGSPKLVVAIAGLLLVICAGAAATLEVNSSRHTMVSEDNPHQAKQAEYFERFGVDNSLAIVVSGSGREARRALVDELATRLQALEGLDGRVLARVGLDEMAELALFHPVGAEISQPGVDPDGYFVTDDGQAALVLVFPIVEGTQQAAEVEPIVNAVREVRDDSLEAIGDQLIQADVTGAAALVVDEQREITRGVLTTTGATVLAIVVMLWLGLRRMKFVGLALLPVALGVLATMAVARILYGELNMVTSSCSSILLGLGIDFGVFLLRRYGELLRGTESVREAAQKTVMRSGVALAIGATTTAAAFLTTTTTEFTAYARLGVIVSIGLFLTMIATLLLMPALLMLTAGEDTTPPAMPRVSGVERLVRHRSRHILALAALAVLGALAGIPSLEFNSRFYDFIPQRAESARALALIESDPVATPLRATIPAPSIEEARRIAEELRSLPSVASVVSPVDALPPVDLARLQLRILLAGAVGEGTALETSVETARAVIERGGYHPTDLPPLLRAQFVSTDGEWIAVHAIPSGNIWDAQTAERFAADVSNVAPSATGLPMHVHAHLTWIRDGFSRAAAGAALVIFLASLLAFRRLTDALLTTLPSALGFIWMLGLLGWLGVPLDPANIVALPLILGISIDASVHLMHRVRERRDGEATIEEVVGETGSAVALASLTTMGGFASLMLAEYGAMSSLGFAMTVGIGCSLVASVLVLPAALVLLARLKPAAVSTGPDLGLAGR